MFPSVTIFVIFLSAVVDVLVYSQGCIAEKNAAHISSSIAVANYIWERLSNFKRTIIVNIFFFHALNFICVSLQGLFQQELQ